MSRMPTRAPRTHKPTRRRRCHRSRRCAHSRRERSSSILRISEGGRCTILSASPSWVSRRGNSQRAVSHLAKKNAAARRGATSVWRLPKSRCPTPPCYHRSTGCQLPRPSRGSPNQRPRGCRTVPCSRGTVNAGLPSAGSDPAFHLTWRARGAIYRRGGPHSPPAGSKESDA